MAFEVTAENLDSHSQAVEIDIDMADGGKPVMFRGAIVEADGLTWWERKIRDLEAKANRGPELANARFKGKKGRS